MHFLLIPLLIFAAGCDQRSTGPAGSTEPETAFQPYGSWESPIAAETTVQGSRYLHTLFADQGYIYWVEGRPEAGGRNTIMRWRAGGEPEDVLPAHFNARSRIHEYGGRSILVANGTIWFSNFADQRLYRMQPGADPVAITPEAPLRFGACKLDRPRQRLVCIREDHRPEGEPRNALVALPLAGESEGEILFGDSDFVSAASLSPDGKRIAFVSWNHPDMPWDATTLWSAEFAADGSLAGLVAHNPGSSEAVIDPQWDARNRLHAISDRDNWWQIYSVSGTDFEALEIPLVEAEIGEPAWTIGRHYYRFLADGRIAAGVTRWGMEQLYVLDPERGSAELLEPGSASVIDILPVGDLLYVVHSPESRPTELLATEAGGGRALVIRRAKDDSPAQEWIPRSRAVSFPTADGMTAHAIYYPPTHPGAQAAPGELPPLMVTVHGGPTDLAKPVYSLSRLYWTSRGFAILDINYRGSSGYGREYRRALYGNWGIADVQDAIHGARWAAQQGLADPRRTVIRGGSAGGFTTLAAHAFHDDFAAGASYFGISDLEALARETHKFESRYLDQLIGPYPERRELYVQRSPIHHLDGFRAPLLLLQGLEDKVVPPNQAEMIFEALKSRGVPAAYLPVAGESHGFRKAENRIRALEAELYFYSRVLGFEPAEELEAVDIVGLGER